MSPIRAPQRADGTMYGPRLIDSAPPPVAISASPRIRVCAAHDRLKSRSAQAVDVEGGRLLRDAGLDGGNAGEIGVTRLGRNDVAHHHMTDARGLDAATRDRFTHG